MRAFAIAIILCVMAALLHGTNPAWAQIILNGGGGSGGGSGTVTSVTCESGNTIAVSGTCPDAFPGYIVNNWYFPIGIGAFAATGTAVNANVIKCFYGAVVNKITIGALAAQVNTLSAGGNFQLALYTNASGRPGTLLSNTSNMSTAATGVITSGGALQSNQQIGPGGSNGNSDIWFCFNADNSAAIFRTFDITGGSGGFSPAGYLGSSSAATILSNSANIIGVSCTGAACQGGTSTIDTATHVWPANLTTSTWVDVVTKTIPMVVFQVVSVP